MIQLIICVVLVMLIVWLYLEGKYPKLNPKLNFFFFMITYIGNFVSLFIVTKIFNTLQVLKFYIKNTNVGVCYKNVIKVKYALKIDGKFKEYCIIFKPLDFEKRKFKIYDENYKNIDMDIETYLGPHLDFHNRMVSPNDLGYKKITIFKNLKNESSFSGEEVIKL